VDAATGGGGPGLPIGAPRSEYVTGLPVSGTPVESVAWLADSVRAHLVYFPVPVTIDRLAVAVLTLGEGATLRLGLYADAGGLPGASIIAPADTLDCSTTGLKQHSFAPVAVPAGTYWAVTQAGGGACKTRTTALGSWWPLGRGTGDAVNTDVMLKATRADSALPASLAGTAWQYDDDPHHGVLMRRSS
jgi:hypothetical protein